VHCELLRGVRLLSTYDDGKLHINGNFARCPVYSLRETKRSYYVYMPLKVAEEISTFSVTEGAW